MRVLHTADWHIGQLFYEYDRSDEHRQFLHWLIQTLQQEHIDVLLISGDVFDLSNPSAAAVKMFYTFLREAIKANPLLQIVITAGNHDSPSRLEAPKPLLESSHIHIIGWVEKTETGNINYEKLLIPLYDKAGKIKTWCLAIPFLRMGDYPVVADSHNPYADGISLLYQEAFEYAAKKKQSGQSVITMGHLHTQQAEVTDLDKTERLIMGGIECIPASAFHKDIRYVALGHIHKAQSIGGKQHIRYSGSPLPLSFSELNYKHQVVVFDLEEEIRNLRTLEVPLFVPLLKIPHEHRPLSEVISLLEQLPPAEPPEAAPYLEVRILLHEPEPALRHKVETALTGKQVRLAKIDVRYPEKEASANTLVMSRQLDHLQPADVFMKAYQSRFNCPVPDAVMQLFSEISNQVAQQED